MNFEFLNNEESFKIALFVTAALVGVLVSYCNRWASLPGKAPVSELFGYLFGDPKSVIKVIVKTLTMIAGAVTLDYLSSLSLSQIILAAFGLGMMVPEKMNEQAKTEPTKNTDG